MEFKVLDRWNDFAESGVMFKIGIIDDGKLRDSLDTDEYEFNKWYHIDSPKLLKTSTGLVYHDGFRGFVEGNEALNHILEDESPYRKYGVSERVFPVRYKGFMVAGYDDPRRPIMVVRHIKVYSPERYNNIFKRMRKA